MPTLGQVLWGGGIGLLFSLNMVILIAHFINHTMDIFCSWTYIGLGKVLPSFGQNIDEKKQT